VKTTAAHRWFLALLPLTLGACASVSSTPTAPGPDAVVLPLESTDRLELLRTRAEPASYQGRHAIRLDPADGAAADRDVLAVVRDLQLTDGEISVEVAGAPRPGAPTDVRGFIGVAFHVSDDGAVYENVYLRPSNGRADDQLRRNHSVQYQSIPEFSWKRLRDETPGQYESYADLQTGAWTRMRIKIQGTRAELYLDGAEQPCLIVRDLKLGARGGRVALWADPTTEAYFRELRLVPTPSSPGPRAAP
jgi:hypothetical protein